MGWVVEVGVADAMIVVDNEGAEELVLDNEVGVVDEADTSTGEDILKVFEMTSW